MLELCVCAEVLLKVCPIHLSPSSAKPIQMHMHNVVINGSLVIKHGSQYLLALHIALRSLAQRRKHGSISDDQNGLWLNLF